MSSFVLCNNYDWEDKYQVDNHKYTRLDHAEDLLGFPKIRVLVHEDWQNSCEWEAVDYLEQQVEILARFGYVTLIYMTDDGLEEVLKVEPLVIPVKAQHEMNWEDSKGEAVVSYEYEDGGCDSGGCHI